METRGGRGKGLSKIPPHLSDTLAALMPASNVTLDPDSLPHSLSSCQCCRFIVTPYQIIITLENLVELCSATSRQSRELWFQHCLRAQFGLQDSESLV